MGLEVIRPPPAFQDLVFGETATGISGALGDGQTKPEPRPELPQFSVRLGQVGGPRSRTLVVHAEDEEAAKRVATRRIGPEWQILQVKPK
jgi:hypothetical protein